MKTYRNIFKVKFFCFFILFLIFILSIIPFILNFIFIPKEINLIVGNKHTFNFNVPAIATITSKDNSVLNVNNQKVDENTNIKLKNTFSIQSNKEGEHSLNISLMGIPVGSVKVNVLPKIDLVPIGNTIGVKIDSNGIIVLGTGTVKSIDGKKYEPAKNILKSGDLILNINSKQVNNKEDIIKLVEDNKEENISIEIERNGEKQTVLIKPVKAEDNKNKIGIWIRDSTQGIGTITYYNPKTQGFGALGHGIVDVDTKDIIKVKSGNIMSSEIIDIRKGEKGNPGELVGNIMNENTIGKVTLNSEVGIYGKITQKQYLNDLKAIPIGLKDQVKIGPAKILCNVEGNEVKEYDIIIENINKYNTESSKSMIIRIVDEELLKKTNGIVQGMSGSPIIQDEKIIGAVTHVFIQEPDKGYGIFIENMINEEFKQKN